MSDTTINVVTLEGAKLALSAGDTLAIMYPGVLRPEQRAQIKVVCDASLPEGVKVIVFDSGVTIAAITKAD